MKRIWLQSKKWFALINTSCLNFLTTRWILTFSKWMDEIHRDLRMQFRVHNTDYDMRALLLRGRQEPFVHGCGVTIRRFVLCCYKYTYCGISCDSVASLWADPFMFIPKNLHVVVFIAYSSCTSYYDIINAMEYSRVQCILYPIDNSIAPIWIVPKARKHPLSPVDLPHLEYSTMNRHPVLAL